MLSQSLLLYIIHLGSRLEHSLQHLLTQKLVSTNTPFRIVCIVHLATCAWFAVYPSKSFNAAKSLEAITAQRSTVLIANQDQVAALNSELQADAAKPEGKRSYDVSTLRSGLVSGGTAKIGNVTLASFA
jgi:lipase chaperone LimK